MNADPDTSLHKSGFISMFWWGCGAWGLEAALLISSVSCTFFSSAHSKTERLKLHDHLEAKYTFTHISSTLITDKGCYYTYCTYKKAKPREVACLA